MGNRNRRVRIRVSDVPWTDELVKANEASASSVSSLPSYERETRAMEDGDPKEDDCSLLLLDVILFRRW